MPIDRRPSRLSRTALGLNAVLAPFPVAYLAAAWLCDIAYLDTFDMQWATFSVWLIAGGLVVAVLPALAGVIAWLAGPRARTVAARLYIVSYAVALTLGIFNAFVHSRDGYTAVMPAGIALSTISVVLFAVALAAGAVALARYRPERY